jgi:peptidoglycan/LPS O-acetylase OafA/YrhL
MDEIRSLTGLRGVAAVCVVFYHYFPLATVTNPIARSLDHGYLAVDLFFVLSGFVMAMNYSPMFASGWSLGAHLRFLGRRIARVYPLYLTATIIGFCFVSAGWLAYTRSAPPGWALLLNVLMIQTWGFVFSFDSPAWSISAEWAAYLVFPALLVPTMFRRPVWGWISALLCAGTLAVLATRPASLIPDYLRAYPLNLYEPAHALSVFRCIPEFALGILAYRLAATPVGQRLGSNRWIAPALCFAVLGLTAMPRTDLAVVLLYPLLVISLTSQAHLPGKLLAAPFAELIGKLSFSIYLMHKLLLGLLNWIYWRAHAAGLPHAGALAAGVCMALTYAIASGAYRTIEVPSRRRLRALFERKWGQSGGAARLATDTPA